MEKQVEGTEPLLTENEHRDGSNSATHSATRGPPSEPHLVGYFGDVPTVLLPVPEWVPDLIEAIAQTRLNAQGIWEQVPELQISTLSQQLSKHPAVAGWTQWAKSLLDESRTRTTSPQSGR